MPTPVSTTVPGSVVAEAGSLGVFTSTEEAEWSEGPVEKSKQGQY